MHWFNKVYIRIKIFTISLSTLFIIILEYFKLFYTFIKKNLERINFFLLIFICVLNFFVIYCYQEKFGIENNMHYIIIIILPRFNAFIIKFLFENRKNITLVSLFDKFKIKLLHIFTLENIFISVINFSISFFLRNKITKQPWYNNTDLTHNFFLVIIIVLINIIINYLIKFIFIYIYHKKK